MSQTESTTSTNRSERTSAYPRSAIVLLGLNLLQALAFVAYRNTNVTFWYESLDESEKYGNDSNFVYGFLLHFTPIFTGFLADNYFGRYYMTLAHIVWFFIGFGCMIGTAFVDSSISIYLAWCGLIIIATAAGINKAVVPTFNADQFTPEYPNKSKKLMFAWYYLLVNVGAVLTSYVIASQKDFIQCFNRPCYPVMYEIEQESSTSDELVFTKLMSYNEPDVEPTGTFLDRAYPRYDRRFIADILQVARVGKLFCIGIPFFTCYNVVYGPWASQFSSTNGQIGPISVNFVTYLTSNPIFCVVLIFLLNKLIMPVMNKCVKVTLLRKMAVGGVAAVICCCCVIVVQYKILADDLPPLKAGTKVLYWSEKSLRTCDIFLTDSGGHQHKLNHLEENMDLNTGNYVVQSSCSISFTIDGLMTNAIQIEKGINILALYPGKNSSEAELYLRRTTYEKVRMIKTQVDVMTCRNGIVFLNGLVSHDGLSVKLMSVFLESMNFRLRVGDGWRLGDYLEFDVSIKGMLGSKIVYFDEVNCQNRTESLPPTEQVLVSPHTVHFSWMLPQNIIFALAEALLGVAALEFAYTQTSDSMKSVVQALWLQTAALGSLLGLALNQFGMSLLTSFYVYAVIMLAGTLIFICFATFYRYVDEKDNDELE